MTARLLIAWTFALAALLGPPMRLMAASLPCAETSAAESHGCCDSSNPTACCCHLDSDNSAELPAPTAPAPSPERELTAPQRLELGELFSLVPSARTLGASAFPRCFPDKPGCAPTPRTVLLCAFLI